MTALHEQYARIYGPPTTYLFHGTRYLDDILKAGEITRPPYGTEHVSLTTDFNVALYFALLPRDDDDYCQAGILVFRRKVLLDAGYRLEMFDGTGEDEEYEIACNTPLSLDVTLDGSLRVDGFNFREVSL